MELERDLLSLFSVETSDDGIDTSSLTKFNFAKSDLFHTNQVDATRQILSKFSKTHLVLLLAQMQSGKTGSFMCTACSMVHFGLVEKVVIFTGVSSVDLYKQLSKSVVDGVAHFNDVMGVDISGSITAIKSSDLDTVVITPKTLVVWDESHYAQDKNNRPFAMFTRNGLLIDSTGKTNELWKERECYLLTVSATPFSEYVDCNDSNVYLNITKEIVTMSPGTGYRGVGDYYQNNDILPSWDISSDMPNKSNKIKFANLLKGFIKEGITQYGIIRTRMNPDALRIIANYSGWSNVVYYDMVNKDMLDGWDTLNAQPKENTLVVLKNMGRLGQVVPKQHVAFVFEDASCDSATDTVLQSLLGRMCGYGPFNPNGTTVFVSGRLTAENQYEEPKCADASTKARIALEIQRLEDERSCYIAFHGNDDFAMSVYEENNKRRIEETKLRIHQEVDEMVQFIKSSEIERYISLMNRKTSDVPRYAKNIIRSKIKPTKTGLVGYSTVPMEIKIDTTSSEWTPIGECADKMYSLGGAMTLTDSLKLGVVRDLFQLIEERKDAFGDEVQRAEVLAVLEDILDGKYRTGEIINFGDLNSKTGITKQLRSRMSESLNNNMPYVDAINATQWRVREADGLAKRLQLFICSPIQKGDKTEGVADFNATSTLYFTGYTYAATDKTRDLHKLQTIPATTCREAFHHSHELTQDITTTWINVIGDEDAFTGLIDTEFPAGKKVRILPTIGVPNTVINHLDKLCVRNNGRFAMERITSKRTVQDKALRARTERYEVFFFNRTKLSMV